MKMRMFWEPQNGGIIGDSILILSHQIFKCENSELIK